jgi:hypothetical protein
VENQLEGKELIDRDEGPFFLSKVDPLRGQWWQVSSKPHLCSRAGRCGATSRNQIGHYGKNQQHQDIHGSRNGVTACEVLRNGETPDCQDHSEFCGKQEAKSQKTRTKPGYKRGRQCETPDYPTRRENDDKEHDGAFQQFRCARSEPGDNPKDPDSPKHKARSEYDAKIEYARFQCSHEGLPPGFAVVY